MPRNDPIGWVPPREAESMAKFYLVMYGVILLIAVFTAKFIYWAMINFVGPVVFRGILPISWIFVWLNFTVLGLSVLFAGIVFLREDRALYRISAMITLLGVCISILEQSMVFTLGFSVLTLVWHLLALETDNEQGEFE